MHACISLDFIKQVVTVAYDKTVVHTSPFTAKFALKSVRVTWKDVFPYVFPEMFTMFNIFSRYEIEETFKDSPSVCQALSINTCMLSYSNKSSEVRYTSRSLAYYTILNGVTINK